MVIHTKTWQKETHGLFDYESQNVLEQTLQTSMSVRIIRLHEGIKLIKDLGHKKKLPAEAKTLGYLIERDGKFWCEMDDLIKQEYLLSVKIMVVEEEN